MKQLLIVRSVSFQQLDLSLPEILKAFPDTELSILTHEHGVLLAEKYSSIKNVYVYPHKGGFSFFKKAASLSGKSFDYLLLPVTNITGAGFVNVLAFGLSVQAREKYIVNVVSDIKKISHAEIILKIISTWLFKGLAALFAFLTCAVLILLSPFMVFAKK